jgi:hypothetical protein
MCDKRGLPVLLTRYAIATKASQAPIVSGDFAVEPSIGLGESTVYTQRLLRTGYLYQYDKARKKWYAYIITNEGYFMPFNLPKRNPDAPAFKGDNTPLASFDPKTGKYTGHAPGEKVGDKNEHGEMTLPDANALATKPCAPEKNGAIAGCVTIPNAKEATEVWFAYADVEWTDAVFKEHQKHQDDAKYLSRHMRKFDVAAWLGGGAHRHACNVKDVAAHVADYVDSAHSGVFAEVAPPGRWSSTPGGNNIVDGKVWRGHFDWSASSLQARCRNGFDLSMEEFDKQYPNKSASLSHAHQKSRDYAKSQGNSALMKAMKVTISAADNLIWNCDRLYSGKGAVLALDDPAGVLIDIVGLMSTALADYREDLQFKYDRKLRIGSLIARMRTEMEDRATANLLAAVERAKNGLEPAGPLGFSASGLQLLKDFEARGAEMLEEARKDAWADYKKKFNEPEQQNFVGKEFPALLEKFRTETLYPLAKAHVAWIQSAPLIEYFKCNFDTHHRESGVAYLYLVSLCIGNTQAYPSCLAQYDKWLNGDVNDKSNLLQRALVCNQDEFAAKVIAGFNKQVETYTLDTPENDARYAANHPQLSPKPSDLISALKGLTTSQIKAVSQMLSDVERNALGYLMLQVSGALKKHIERTITELHPSPGLAAANLMSGVHFAVVRYNTTGAHIIDRAAEEMFNFILKRSVLPQDLVRIPEYDEALKIMKKELIIQAGEGYSQRIRSGTFGVNLIALKQVMDESQGKTPEQLALALSKTFYSLGHVEHLPDSWSQEEQYLKGGREAMQMVGKRLALGASVLGGLFSFVALGAAIADVEKTNKFGVGQSRALGKLVAAWVGVAGVFGDVIEKAAKSGYKIPIVRNLSERHVRYFQRLGRAGGSGAAFISAILDAKSAWESAEKGEVLLRNLYLTSAGLNLATIVFIWKSVPIWLVLAVVVVTMIVAAIIQKVKANDLQEWLYRCCFGLAPESEKYKTLDAELTALQVVGRIF